MSDEQPGPETLDDFARHIMQVASKSDVPLPQKIAAFKEIAAYQQADRKNAGDAPKTPTTPFDDMRNRVHLIQSKETEHG